MKPDWNRVPDLLLMLPNKILKTPKLVQYMNLSQMETIALLDWLKKRDQESSSNEHFDSFKAHFAEADEDQDARLNPSELKQFFIKANRSFKVEGVPFPDLTQLSEEEWQEIYAQLNQMNPLSDHVGLPELLLQDDHRFKQLLKLFLKILKHQYEWRAVGIEDFIDDPNSI